MQLGILQIANTVQQADPEPLAWLEKEFIPFFKIQQTQTCREEVFAIKQALQSFHQVDVLIVLADLGLHQQDHTVAFLTAQLDSRLQPLEEAVKFALVQRSGPLAALNTPVAGLIKQCYVVAIPANLAEIKVITEYVLKPFLLNHVFFDKIKVKPLDMLEEYLKSG